MFIKRIEIRGFKSIDRKTSVELTKGLNVITGPNGSGKCIPAWEQVNLPNEYISAEELFEELSHGGVKLASEPNAEYALSPDPIAVCTVLDGKVTSSHAIAGFKKYKSGMILRISTSDHREIYLSLEHKLFTFPGVWIRSAELRKGAKVGVVEDNKIKWDVIENIEELHYKGYFYDFYIGGLHAYLAGSGSFIVHNSNILDAVKFVLGESRPRPLRTDKLSALISDKAKEKRAVVKIVLDNSDKKIPTASDEVIFTRNMNENGESNYFIDRKKTSKLVFANTLAIAGLSNRSYNIVMQGEILRLADKDPEEIREEIESAIGLAQYDKRKAQAEEELRAADTNVKVASARLEEVRSRLESLEHERNVALKSIQINEELKKMRASLLTSKIAELKKSLEFEMARARDFEQKVENAKAAIEKLSDTRKQKLSRLIELSDLLSKTNFSPEGGFERKLLEVDMKIKSCADLIEIKRRDLKRVKNSRKLLRKKLALAKMQLEPLERQLLKTNNKLAYLNKEFRREQEKIKNLTLLKKKKEDFVERLRRDIYDLAANLKLLDSEVYIKVSTIKSLKSSMKDLRKQIARYNRDILLTSNQLKFLEKTFQKVSERIKLLEDGLRRKSDQLKTFEKENEYLSEVIQRGSIKLAEIGGKLSALKEVSANASKLNLDDLISGMGANVLGKLRDLIEFDMRFEKAVSVALEDWLDAYVVSDPYEALAISITLRNLGVFKGKIISAYKSEEVKKASLDEGALLSKIRCPDDIKPALRALVGNLKYVRSIEEAKENLSKGIPVVTEDGILISPPGLSRVSGTETPYGARKLEAFFLGYINDLSRQLDEANLVKKYLLNDMLIKLRDDIEATNRDLLAAKGVENDLNVTIEKLREFMKRSTEELKEAEKNLGKLKETLKENEGALIATLAKKAKIHSLLSRNHTRSNAAIVEVRKISKNERRSRKRAIAIGKNMNKLSKRSKTLSRVLSEVKQRASYLETSIKSIKVKSKELRDEINELYSRLRTLKLERSELSTRLEEGGKARLDYSTLDSERKQLSADIEALESELKIKESEFIEYNQRAKELSILVDKIKSDCEACERELHSLEVTPMSTPTKVNQSLIEELEEELSNLGPLNMLAIEQYEQQAENYRVVSSRLNKLEEERRAIIDFMNTIESQKREAFLKALEEVNGHFSSYFNKITGGSAWLELEDSQNPFNGGVNIIVQFPTKSPRVASALSGGEKSVVALCFIFAMQSLKPSPFYILDEVDAHLDVVNVEKYANILKDRSAESQIITISLKDYVASKADKVLGVYNKNGSSRIVELPRVEREMADVQELAR